MSFTMTATYDISALLEDYRSGHPQALELLVPLVYQDLRKIARRSLNQFGNLTINTTDLVHETYLKMSGQRVLSAKDRAHFLAICARAMRQFVLNYVRDRNADKRGAGLLLLDLDNVEVALEPDIDQILFIEAALKKLEEVDEGLVRIFECRFFAGLSDEETAEATERPLRSVQRDWMRARAWIRELIESPR
jgi:RNA polymerase sigma factor (TIGR02999 family)